MPRSWIWGAALALGAVLSVVGVVDYVVYGFTPAQMVLSSDEMVYVDVARNLAAGHGLSISTTTWKYPNDLAPLVHFPPAFPILLGGLSAVTGLDPVFWATPVKILLYVLILVTVGELTWSIIHDRWACVASVVLVGLSKIMLHIHQFAFSEPLFVLLILLALKNWLDYGGSASARFWWGSALWAGLAAVTRYQGAFLIPAGSLIFLLTDPRPMRQGWKTRLLRSATWGLVAAVSLGVWWIRCHWAPVDIPEGTVGFHPPGYGEFWTLLNTVGGWFVFRAASLWLKLAVVLIIGAWMIFGWVISCKHPPQTLLRKWFLLIAIFSGFQMIFLLWVYTYLNNAFPFDDRILSSLGIVGLITAVVVFFAVARQYQRRRLVVAAGILMTVLILTSDIYNSSVYWYRFRSPEAVSARKHWIAQIDGLLSRSDLWEGRRNFYTCAPKELQWWLGRPFRHLPGPDDRDLEDFFKAVREQNGMIVHFTTLPFVELSVSAETLRNRSDLQAIPLDNELTVFIPRQPLSGPASSS